MIGVLEVVTEMPKLFFDFLPRDWGEHILPLWPNLKETSDIYTLKNERNKLVCGGIVFKESLPTPSSIQKTFISSVDKNWYYLGYIYTDTAYRNQGLASKWLHEVMNLDKNVSYWLTTEEQALSDFYLKNGFQLYCHDTENMETLFIFDRQ